MGESHASFEDLMRPVKDALLKNWSMSLTHLLDEFINHLQHDSVANFAQAAILLQNSTTFYCKRVEVVFKLIEDLNDGVNHLKSDQATCSGSTPSKRRRIARTLDNDDLDLLDLVYSDHNIDLNMNKLRTVSPKQIVLNKEIKAVKKPDTSVPLSSASVFFGYKDDFRVFGKTWSDGSVNRDFHNNWTRNLVCPDAHVAGLTNGFHQHDSDEQETDVNDNIPKDALSNGLSVNVNGISLNDLSTIPPLKEVKVTLRKIVDWPFLLLFKFPYAIRLPKRVFRLPIALIRQAEIAREKRRKLDEKKNARREKKLAKLKASMEAEPMDVDQPDNTIDEGVECFANSLPVNGENVIVNGGGDSEILRFLQQRKQQGQEETEFAKRVSAWHESVLPRLQEAESRRKFNVHEYGTKILDNIPDSDVTFHSFREIVQDQPVAEVCRYFLSTLMLANTYNVEIRRTESSPLATDCVELRVLTKTRHHEEMDQEMENLF